MATWAAVQGTLVAGANSLMAKAASINSVQGVQNFLRYAVIDYPDPVVKIMAVVFLVSVLVALLGSITDNYSWVDKSWSILPPTYAWMIVLHTFHATGAAIHPRLAILAAVATIWGIRLTYNFYRKGGYSWSGEDYRWPIIRKEIPNAILWQVFNLVFIAFTQSILLASLLSPVYVAWTASYGPRGKLLAPLNEIDYLAAALVLSFILMETVADEQQWAFQTKKYELKKSGKRLTEPYSKGFIDSGLFKYSRHPNFFAEQAIWWSMNLFATAATGKWTGWWMAGAFALSALFQASTTLTEKITAAKYRQYKEYQKATSRLMPWFPAATGTEAAAAGGGGAGGSTTPRAQTRRRSTSATPKRAAMAAEEAAPAAAAAAEAPVAAAAVDEAPAARGRGRTATRRTSTAKKPAASTSRSRSASAKKAAPAKKEAAAAPAPRSRSASAKKATSTAKKAAPAAKKSASPAKKPASAPKASRSRSAAKKTSTSPAKKPAAAATTAPRRSTRARS